MTVEDYYQLKNICKEIKKHFGLFSPDYYCTYNQYLCFGLTDTLYNKSTNSPTVDSLALPEDTGEEKTN